MNDYSAALLTAPNNQGSVQIKETNCQWLLSLKSNLSTPVPRAVGPYKEEPFLAESTVF